MSLNKVEIHDGFQEITFDLLKSNAFELIIKANAKADVLVHLNGEGEASIEVSVLKNAQLNLFYLNASVASKLVENYRYFGTVVWILPMVISTRVDVNGRRTYI